MNIETLLTFTAVAGLAILSPGPAILLALRNGVAYGSRSVIWSSLGNVTGIFCLSASAMLGLGVLLMSSAVLFAIVKLLGALYLLYVGIRHLIGRASLVNQSESSSENRETPSPQRLFREALLLAITNPKPILFFTALFPQFVTPQMPLLPQFLVLTSIFMALSFATLNGYAFISSRARHLLFRPLFLKWLNRFVGAVFVSFGAALLTLRRHTS